MLYDDNPIKTSKDDLLNRSSFVERITNVIADWKSKESLVIAMWGKWWSGKTSVINLIEQSFWDNVDFFRFDPWLYNQETDIQKKFFEEIWEDLKTNWKIFFDSTLIESLEVYSQRLSLLSSDNIAKFFSKDDLIWLVFVFWWVASLFWMNMHKFNNFVGNRLPWLLLIVWCLILLWDKLVKFWSYITNIKTLTLKSKKRTIKEIRLEIEEALLKRDKKLVIVIDDIERLTPEQAKSIFQIVKTNANFPNIIFFLVFDRDVLLDVLKNQNMDWEYLYKIIQVYFDIPQVSQPKVWKYLFSCLDEIIDKELPKGYVLDNDYWSNAFHIGLKERFASIRDVKRFCNSMRFNIKLLVNKWYLEVNPIDFMIIECLRNFQPALFYFIKDNKSLLLSGKNRYSSGSQASKEVIRAKLKDLNHESDYELIEHMFPQVTWTYDVWDRWSTWSKNLRICSDQYFDAFFSYIPWGDEWKINNYDVKSFLKALNNLSDAESYIDSINKDKDIREFLSRVMTHVDDLENISDESIINLLISVANKYNSFPQSKSWIWDFWISTDVWRLFYRWLKRFYGANERFIEVVKYILKKSDVIYPIVSYINHHILDEKDKSSLDGFILTAEEKDQIKSDMMLSLEKYLNKDKKFILNDPELLHIIYTWEKYLYEPDKAKQYVANLTNKSDAFLKFLRLYITTSFSQTIWSYHQKKTQRINFANVYELLPKDLVTKRMKSLMRNKVLYMEHKSDIDFIVEHFGKVWKSTINDE